MKKIIFIVLIGFLIAGCTQLDLKNLNNPDRSKVLSTSDGVVTLIKGAYLNTVKELLGYRSPYYEFLADQLSSCSLSAPWPFNKEPRVNIPNTVANENVAGRIFGGSYSHWTKLYANIGSVNNCLLVMNKGLKIVDGGNDISEVTKGDLLFIRGVNLGYIGMLYRRGAIMKPDTDPAKIKLVSYSEVIAAAVKDLEAAKTIYKANPSHKNDYFHGGPSGGFSVTDLEKIINTFAAKFLIAQARSKSEASKLDVAKIKSYLNNAYEKNFTLTGDRGKSYYNRLQYYAARVRRGRYGYCCDQKIPYLMSQVDGASATHKRRPRSLGTNDMPAITSKDARLGLYYQHAQAVKFYYYERDPQLYSNYRFKRYYRKDYGDYDMLLFTTEEIRLLKAEVAYWEKNYTAAKTLIDGGERVKTGKLAPVAATEAAISDALFYENCIELNGGGLAIAWTFMRRHDRLQKGTLLHMPVYDLEVQNLLAGKTSNIGGVEKADGVDTALETSRSWIKQSEIK